MSNVKLIVFVLLFCFISCHDDENDRYVLELHPEYPERNMSKLDFIPSYGVDVAQYEKDYGDFILGFEYSNDSILRLQYWTFKLDSKDKKSEVVSILRELDLT